MKRVGCLSCYGRTERTWREDDGRLSNVFNLDGGQMLHAKQIIVSAMMAAFIWARRPAPLAPPETCEWREDDEGALMAGCPTAARVRFSWAVAKGFAACPYCKSPLSLSSGGTERKVK